MAGILTWGLGNPRIGSGARAHHSCATVPALHWTFPILLGAVPPKHHWRFPTIDPNGDRPIPFPPSPAPDKTPPVYQL